MKRLLDCTASDFHKMHTRDLIQSIYASEGRVILAEVASSFAPHYQGVTNPEIVSAFGADLVLLNYFDVFEPRISGLEVEIPFTTIKQLKEIIGRPVGLTLEPVDPEATPVEPFRTIPEGRIASQQTFLQAKKLGFDFICLTGNERSGVTNDQITKMLKKATGIFGESSFLFAGKMHAAGVSGEMKEAVITESVATQFIDAGADAIFIPSPGTVPGVSIENAQKVIKSIQRQGALAVSSIGTSQEDTDQQTIRRIGLHNKMIGADIHHIGSTNFNGMADPENILAYSIAIRGKRHTYVRMASSVLR